MNSGREELQNKPIFQNWNVSHKNPGKVWWHCLPVKFSIDSHWSNGIWHLKKVKCIMNLCIIELFFNPFQVHQTVHFEAIIKLFHFTPLNYVSVKRQHSSSAMCCKSFTFSITIQTSADNELQIICCYIKISISTLDCLSNYIYIIMMHKFNYR